MKEHAAIAHPVTRRSFLRSTSLLGASTILSTRTLSLWLQAEQKKTPPDLAAVVGSDPYTATVEAIRLIGGIKKFVPRGATVGLLVNSRFGKPGTYVKPEIALAVITLCYEAGAKGIYSLEDVSDSYWKRSPRSKDFSEQIRSLKSPTDESDVSVPRGKVLKRVKVAKEFLDCDVIINVPVIKDHEGTRFTGTLKNLMGTNLSGTNRFFHLGSNAGAYYGDVNFLSQCIADENTLRRPALCIADATEFVTTNGPFGPGNLSRPKTVVACPDGVALDAYCTRFLGLAPGDVLMITKAREHGLGEIDLSKLTITESEI